MNESSLDIKQVPTPHQVWHKKQLGPRATIVFRIFCIAAVIAAFLALSFWFLNFRKLKAWQAAAQLHEAAKEFVQNDPLQSTLSLMPPL